MFRRWICSQSIMIFILIVLLHSLALPAQAADDNANNDNIPSFTSEEKEYISSKKSLKIGYVQDRIPISFTKDGELAGVSRYIFDHLSHLCGLKFEYVPLPNGAITYDYLLDEGFDLVTSVEYNKENQNARGILISNPYLSSRKVVVARKKLDFDYNANLSIAISSGSQTIKTVLKKAYPNFSLVDYTSITDCFDAVNTGDVDLMIQNQYVAEYWLAKPSYEKLSVIPVIGLDDQLCFSAVVAFNGKQGTSEAEGQTLIDILNKSIARITEDEIGSYTIQSIMDYQYNYTLADFLYRYRYAVSILILAVIIILVLTILLSRQRVLSAENRADAKIKEQFLSTMSHEIRTPLNGLIGLNHLMTQKLDDRKQLETYLQQSTMTANYLLSLVNDILDMSKLEEQKMELIFRPINLDITLSNIKLIVQNAMADKKLTYLVDSELPWPCVLGDEVRIQQIVLNLLDNARKFTPEGGLVKLSARQQMTDSKKIVTTITISDTGRGMSEEFQKHIFDAFAQELDTVSKGNQGTGLGLPISRRLALLMDGDLTFVSNKGQGSSFTFTFTSQPADLQEKVSVPTDNSKRTCSRILIAEDNELNGEILFDLLTNAGFEVDLAENGKKALDQFAASAPGTFDTILMDLLMPEMNGFESTKAIRALDRPDAKTVRIFACTANSFSQDREKALLSGMDDFITKPIDIEELLKKLRS